MKVLGVASTFDAPAKTTPVDADSILLFDSAATPIGKVSKLTWAYVKSVLKTYFDVQYAQSGDTNLHVIAVGTSNNGKVLTAGGSAGSLTWSSGGAAPNGIPGGGTTAQVLSKIDATNYNAQWIDNVPTIPVASTSVSGITSLATQAEVITGTDAVKIVTSATLQGLVQSTTANVDFGATDDYSATFTIPASWVLASSIITCSYAAVTTADHDPEDAAIENMTVTTGNIVPGVSFDAVCCAPEGTFGVYTLNIVGIQ